MCMAMWYFSINIIIVKVAVNVWACYKTTACWAETSLAGIYGILRASPERPLFSSLVSIIAAVALFFAVPLWLLTDSVSKFALSTSSRWQHYLFKLCFINSMSPQHFFNWYPFYPFDTFAVGSLVSHFHSSDSRLVCSKLDSVAANGLSFPSPVSVLHK